MFACQELEDMLAEREEVANCRTTKTISAKPKLISRPPLRSSLATPLASKSHMTPEEFKFKMPPHRQCLVNVKRHMARIGATCRYCAIIVFCIAIFISSHDHFLPTSKCHSQEQQQSTISDNRRPSSLIGLVDALLQQAPPSAPSSPLASTIYLQTNISTDSSSPLAPPASSIQRRDLDSVQRQDKSRPEVAPTIGNGEYSSALFLLSL